MAKYYTLFVYDADEKIWTDEFGDYDRANVEYEAEGMFPWHKKKHLKIIAWDDEKENPQEFIAKKNRELNGEPEPAPKTETPEPAAEYYVLKGSFADKEHPYVCAAPKWKRRNFQGCTYGDLFSAIEFESAEKAQEWIETVRDKQRRIWDGRSWQLAYAYPVKCKREIVKTISFDEFKAGV